MAATKLADFAKLAQKKQFSKKDAIKPKVSASTPRRADERVSSYSEVRSEVDFLAMLKRELATPFLALLEQYVRRTSQNRDIKDLGGNMYLFKKNCPVVYWTCFSLDFVLVLLFAWIVLRIGLRGLQISLWPIC